MDHLLKITATLTNESPEAEIKRLTQMLQETEASMGTEAPAMRRQTFEQYARTVNRLLALLRN